MLNVNCGHLATSTPPLTIPSFRFLNLIDILSKSGERTHRRATSHDEIVIAIYL